MPKAVAKPFVQKHSAAGSARQKADLKRIQAQPGGSQSTSHPPARHDEASTVIARRKSASVDAGHKVTVVEKKPRGLIDEVLRSSPAKAAQAETWLKPDATTADPSDAGLELLRQMQRAEGGAWTGAELRTRFGLTPATLHRRRADHRILFWRDAQENFHYPKWQFTLAGASLPGVQEVLQTFCSSDEWRLMRYFLAPRKQLDDRAPLALLQKEEKDKVFAHARVHGQENTW